MTKIYTALFSLVLFISFPSFGQVFPYFEAFDTYTAGQPANGNGGLVATSHVTIQPRGVDFNSVDFQMTSTPGNDTLVSPLIGPLTAHTATSFYFRIVQNLSNVTPYTLASNDKVIINVGNGPLTITVPQYTITSANQNTTLSYVKVTVAAPSFVNGLPGKFQIIAYNPGGHSWVLEMDSFVVRDTLIIAPVLASVVTDAHCRSDSTGSIAVRASGASAPYTYRWSTGDTTPAITHRPAGIYTVTVTDSLSATASLSDTIREPQFTLLFDSLTHSNIKCRGDAAGTATAYPIGGTPGYNYVWSTSPTQQTTQEAIRLIAGNYGVTVTDSRGCTVSATTQITQPSAALSATMSSTGSSGSNGTATVIANGGTSPFTYVWAPGSQTTPIAVNLAPGLYRVTVTDGNNCTLLDSVVVSNLVGITEADSKALQIYPNPASDKLFISVDGKKQSALAVSLSDMSGRIIFSENTISDHINIASLTDGIYIVRIDDGAKAYIRRVTIKK